MGEALHQWPSRLRQQHNNIISLLRMSDAKRCAACGVCLLDSRLCVVSGACILEALWLAVGFWMVCSVWRVACRMLDLVCGVCFLVGWWMVLGVACVV